MYFNEKQLSRVKKIGPAKALSDWADKLSAFYLANPPLDKFKKPIKARCRK